MNKEDIIQHLGLVAHQEGGYYVRTYQSPFDIETSRKSSKRALLTSIYYLLTDDRPVGHFHINQSDIIHYFHAGSPITYLIVHPDGRLEKVAMGADLTKGQLPQLIVKGGCWKASHLESGEFGLISEAVAPGFDYSDMELGSKTKLHAMFPHLSEVISRYTKDE